MKPPERTVDWEQRLESLTVALNRELWAEGAGLPFDEAAVSGISRQLEHEHHALLGRPGLLHFALDGLGEARCSSWDLDLRRVAEASLVCPAAARDGAPVHWRDWKSAERDAADPRTLRRLFHAFIDGSGPLVEPIEARYSGLRQLYADHGTTPLDVFASREGTTAPDLRRLLSELGEACRAPFCAALVEMSRAVFGHGNATVAEVHALHNNRMYEPLAPLAAGRDPLAAVRRALELMGFRAHDIALDFEDRPGKYAGAFCFPVQIPGDVRISVRPVSPHHLEDMLFHEHGHALHFAGIDPDLPFVDRYWIRSGTHETFATLFETLTALPGFAPEVMGLDESGARALACFARFKFLLTGAWLGAAAAAVCDAWIERLPWLEVEQRLAAHVERFTGLHAPPAWARLDPFVSKVDPYVVGYAMAAVRVVHWLDVLRAGWGDRWWADPRAGESIRRRMSAGGRVSFEPAWLEVSAFARRWVETDRAPAR
jgi:hypothetical protein